MSTDSSFFSSYRILKKSKFWILIINIEKSYIQKHGRTTFTRTTCTIRRWDIAVHIDPTVCQGLPVVESFIAIQSGQEHKQAQKRNKYIDIISTPIKSIIHYADLRVKSKKKRKKKIYIRSAYYRVRSCWKRIVEALSTRSLHVRLLPSS